MKNHYLYQIICLIPNENGVLKIYSGVRSCKKLPQDDEYFGSGHYLKSAIKKHGKENFVKTIIGTFPTREEAYAAETAWLEKKFDFAGRDWKTFNSMFYNLRMNEAFHNDGGSVSEITKEKMSQRGKGRVLTEEHKRKIGQSQVGKIISDEHKEKVRKSRLGKKLSIETRTKLSTAHSGRVFSDEHKQKLSKANSGSKSAKFKGFAVGINDDKVIIFSGEKDIHSRGFQSAPIYKCIKNIPKYVQPQGFKWIRTNDKNTIVDLLKNRSFADKESEDHFNSME